MVTLSRTAEELALVRVHILWENLQYLAIRIQRLYWNGDGGSFKSAQSALCREGVIC